ncbi:hypothetical protein K474DRAFT_364455 [Panus rudis PR-1116 ss-1]|nr:hypothetical protein K474DRAFT_364455 [Panus rudis PR-1116 ss-1]
MPFAPVNEDGAVLYFEDSGPPPTHNGVYTTVILIHGTSWNGGVFRKVLPFGPEQNLRIITLNQRDYTSSTPLSTSELAQLTSQSPRERLQYLKDRAKEIAKFMLWLVENEKLPPVDGGHSDGGGAQGGVALVGWSSGNHLILPLLAFGGEFLNPEEQSLLGKYLRSYVMFDSPPDIAGIPPPILGDPKTTPGGASNYALLADPNIAKLYASLASSYFTHSSTVLNALSTISHSSQSQSQQPFQLSDTDTDTDTGGIGIDGVSDSDILKGFAAGPDTEIPPSITDMPPELTEPIESVKRSQIPVVYIGEGIYKYVRQKALFGDTSAGDSGLDIGEGEDGGGNGVWLPRVRTEVVSCGRSAAICVWTVWKLYQVIRDRAKDVAPQGTPDSSARTVTSSNTQRPIHFHLWKDFNHFPHWDQPQEYVKLLAGVV